MKSEAFNTPQRQSVMGVALIFLITLFKILRGFWVVGVYLILKTPTGPFLYYSVMGLMVLILFVLVYSYFYYRNFLFHIDYKKREFKLQKGVFSTRNIALPFDKIQQVYLERSLLQRLINVYSVVVDTAGSKSEEVNINAVSKEDADLLSLILTRAKAEVHPETAEDAERETQEEPEEIWTHQLDVLTLLKIGISTNYLRGLALVLAFFTTIYNELSSVFREYAEEMSEYFDQVPGPSESIGFFLILIVLLLIISIIITVLEVFLKYYGLKLTQTSRNLVLEMGLKTNTRVSLQPRRVQLMQVLTNPVQRKFNLHEARIALASSEDALHKKRIKIPGLQIDTVDKVKSYLYGEPTEAFQTTFRPHKLMLMRRFVTVFIPLLVSYLILYWYPYMTFRLWFILAVTYAVVGSLYQFLRYRSLQLIFSDEFLKKKQGVWNKREENFEVFKMQAVTIKQPFWYRRRNLVNLEFHTAGGDVTFKAVNTSIFTYINYLLYKVECTKKKWM